MKFFDLDSAILLTFIAFLSLLIMLALSYDNLGVYRDTLITFITVFSFIVLIFDRFVKKK